MTYQIQMAEIIAKPETPVDGTIEILINYMHGDADADTDETLTFEPSAPLEGVGKYVEGLNALIAAGEYDRINRRAAMPKLMEIFGDEDSANEFYDNAVVDDVTCDHEYPACITDYTVTIWHEGVEHGLNVLRDDVLISK